MIEEMQAKKARNDANNANMVKNLAEVASKTENPYAKAIGTGVKAADKLTGGKASEKLGKVLTKNNKINPGGRMLQKATNKLSESGMGDRLANAMKAKNNPTSKAAFLKQMASKNNATNNLNVDTESTSTNQKDVEEQTSDGGLSNYDLSYKVIRNVLIGMIPACLVLVIICLFTASSQIFINAIGLDAADSTSSKAAEDKIGNLKEKELDREIEDANANTSAYDIYISDEKSELLRQSKLNKYVQIARKTYIERKYRESDLENLHDFYPPMKTLNTEYDENLVTDFFFKMYNLNNMYMVDYGVNLDMPLLMATLKMQSSDMNEVFASNLSDEDRKPKIKESLLKDYDYYKDWSDYKVSRDNSVHDMEVLAQRMVVIDETKSACETKDGKCYKVDIKKYKEFLKEFLEKKYFLKGENSLSVNEVTQNSSNVKSNSMAEAMINIANQEYISNGSKKGGKKYWSAAGYGSRIEWCAIFAWYISSKTEYGGVKLYPNIIDYKSASTGAYMKYFYNSTNPNINFYYNDSCSVLKGKNGTLNYTPKPGDYIFFDWQRIFRDISQTGPGTGPQDHTGIVEKYENGIVYTIEGNISDTIIKRKFKIDDCRIIGFGSWY